MAPPHHRLVGDDLKKLQTYVKDYAGALINNYECVKYLTDKTNSFQCAVSNAPPPECKIEDPSVPTSADLNADSPLAYSKCFFNLGPSLTDNISCVVKNCDKGLCDDYHPDS